MSPMSLNGVCATKPKLTGNFLAAHLAARSFLAFVCVAVYAFPVHALPDCSVTAKTTGSISEGTN